jgi:hypothetical protein
VQISFRDLSVEKAISFDGNNGRFTDLQVNQAIKEAINSDPVLSKLLVVKDGPNRALIIESLIDGDTAITDLAIGFARGTVPTGNTLPLLDGATVGTVVPTTAAALAAAYAPEYALVADPAGDISIGSVANPTVGTAGLVDVQTITLTVDDVADLAAGGTFDFSYDGSAPVGLVMAPGATLADLQAAIQAEVAPAANAVLAGGVITITAVAVGAVVGATLTEAGTAFGAIAAPTVGEDAAVDVQTITLSPADVAGLVAGASVEFLYDGALVNVLVGPAGSAAGAEGTFVATTANLITITATGAAAPVAVSPQPVLNNAGFVEADGSDSVAHSDNVITIAGGDDVVVLGTNDTDALAGGESVGSNDTVAFTATAADVNLTIVDFTTGNVPGFDTLDFTAYLGSASSGFNNGAFAGTTANAAITLVGFGGLATGVTGLTFDALTAAQFQVAVNAGTDAAALAATKNVFLVQDGADNVFKVFTTESAANSADFTNVKLVGVVDMADTDVNSLTFDNFA